MDALIALTVLAAAAGEPALLGGPTAHEPAPRRVYAASHVRTVEGRYAASSRIHEIGFDAGPPLRAGDPVRLDPGFFATPLAGGVERPALVRVYGRGGVVVLHAGGRSAPVSAGRAAAARGLPRG